MESLRETARRVGVASRRRVASRQVVESALSCIKSAVFHNDTSNTRAFIQCSRVPSIVLRTFDPLSLSLESSSSMRWRRDRDCSTPQSSTDVSARVTCTSPMPRFRRRPPLPAAAAAGAASTSSSMMAARASKAAFFFVGGFVMNSGVSSSSFSASASAGPDIQRARNFKVMGRRRGHL